MRTLFARVLADLGRNRLHSVVTLAGLAMALAAAILIGLFVRQQYSYEQFIPGHERIYRLTGSIAQPGQAERISQVSPPMLAAALRSRAEDIEAVARIAYNFPALRAAGKNETVRELRFGWADPDFFRVMPLPVIAGDLASALDTPNSVVLTRSAARRYFGRDKPVGAYLERVFRDDVMRLRVTAVIEDLPATTHLDREVIASARTAGSDLAIMDANPNPGIGGGLTYTYLRAKPGADAATLQPALDDIVKPIQAMAAASGTKIRLWAEPIAAIHFGPGDPNLPSAKPTIAPATVQAIGTVGLLILLMAATNYVALMTARAGRRATEVAVRKAAGASQGDLIVEFLGESLFHILIAMLLAMALAELLLPLVNAALDQSLSFNLLHEPGLALFLLVFAFVLALLAGLYPAFILSAFRPTVAVQGGPQGLGGHAMVRQAMVVAQYAILIGLVVSTVTIYRQTSLALGQSMSAGRGPVLLLVMSCNRNVVEQVRALPGVKAATCSSGGAMNFTPQGGVTVIKRTGERLTPGFVEVDPFFFEAFGIEPVAGRVFSQDTLADRALHRIVLSETAARHFGFDTPQNAVGQSIGLSLEVGEHPKVEQVEIVGVVPDRPTSVFTPAGELIYNDWFDSGVLAVTSRPDDLPRMREELKRWWNRQTGGEPFSTNSLEQFDRDRYRGLLLQGKVIGICAALALIIAAMGLFALTTFMTEQRTREIGVRKAMGAGTGDIMSLLLWQFARPVLLAALIAIPVSDFLMRRWLEQFAARVELPIWLGAAALAGALVIALAVVSAHALAAARARPARSLRYE